MEVDVCAYLPMFVILVIGSMGISDSELEEFSDENNSTNWTMSSNFTFDNIKVFSEVSSVKSISLEDFKNRQKRCDTFQCPSKCNLTFLNGCPHNCNCRPLRFDCPPLDCPQPFPVCVVYTKWDTCQHCACQVTSQTTMKKIQDPEDLHLDLMVFRPMKLEGEAAPDLSLIRPSIVNPQHMIGNQSFSNSANQINGFPPFPANFHIVMMPFIDDDSLPPPSVNQSSAILDSLNSEADSDSELFGNRQSTFEFGKFPNDGESETDNRPLLEIPPTEPSPATSTIAFGDIAATTAASIQSSFQSTGSPSEKGTIISPFVPHPEQCPLGLKARIDRNFFPLYSEIRKFQISRQDDELPLPVILSYNGADLHRFCKIYYRATLSVGYRTIRNCRHNYRLLDLVLDSYNHPCRFRPRNVIASHISCIWNSLNIPETEHCKKIPPRAEDFSDRPSLNKVCRVYERFAKCVDFTIHRNCGHAAKAYFGTVLSLHVRQYNVKCKWSGVLRSSSIKI